MAANWPCRTKGRVCLQTLGNGLGELPGGVIGLRRVASCQVIPYASPDQPNGEVGQGRNLLAFQPSPAPAAIVGRIFESHLG
jgi:hypothetical protein